MPVQSGGVQFEAKSAAVAGGKAKGAVCMAGSTQEELKPMCSLRVALHARCPYKDSGKVLYSAHQNCWLI